MPRFPHVGFTARRDGLSPDQLAVLPLVLTDLHTRCGARTLHHGDSVGGDEQGAEMARSLGYRIVGHPPTAHPEHGDELRAFVRSDDKHDPLPPRVRDCVLVDQSDVLIAFPPTDRPTGDSGTWYCIAYSTTRWATRPRLVIGPTGRVLDSVGVGGLWEPLPEGRAG